MTDISIDYIIKLVEQLYEDGYNPNTILIQTDQNGMVVQQRGPKFPELHIDQLREILK